MPKYNSGDSGDFSESDGPSGDFSESSPPKAKAKGKGKAWSSSISIIGDAVLGRMALKAGLTRVAHTTFEEVRGTVSQHLGDVVTDAITYMDHERRKTVSVADVMHAIENRGFTKMYEVKGPLKPCKVFTCEEKRKIFTRIKAYQKQSDCYLLPRAGFIRLVREMGADSKTGVRYEADALLNLQAYIEIFILKGLKDAALLMLHAGRTTLNAKDVQLVTVLHRDARHLA